MKKAFIVLVYLLFTACLAFAEPTAEGILQTVANNYGKIEDLSAVIISSGTVKTPQDPQGQTSPDESGKFFIKKPNKMKVVYAHETVMSDGDTFYSLQDGKLVGKVDITNENTGKLNFYFEIDKFKQGHTFALKGSKMIGADTIYILECLPKEDTKATYKKLILEINYDKGLDIKKEMYTSLDDFTPQSIEEALSWQLIDNIWIITKVYEKNIILDATIESWSRYTDIKVNTGIGDEEFKP